MRIQNHSFEYATLDELKLTAQAGSFDFCNEINRISLQKD
jgi:hypothetical protein